MSIGHFGIAWSEASSQLTMAVDGEYSGYEQRSILRDVVLCTASINHRNS